MRLAPRSLAACAIALAVGGCAADEGGGDGGALRVFAAASLVEAAGELAATFEERGGARVELNLAGSNTLAQQILAAPGADVFLSADRHWIEVLEGAKRLVAGSRRPLFGNRLVLIAQRASTLRLERPAELASADFSHLAVADPEAVPAGRYARAALDQVPLGDGTLWRAVAPRLAPALDVRAALALVESDPAILGIVYRTDALRSENVRVLYEFPARGAGMVTYYGALVEGGAGDQRQARRFLDLAAGADGLRIAERYGFGGPSP